MKKFIGIMCLISLFFVGAAGIVDANAWSFWSNNQTWFNSGGTSTTPTAPSTPSIPDSQPSEPTQPNTAASNLWGSYWSTVNWQSGTTQPSQPVQPQPIVPIQPTQPVQQQPRQVPKPSSNLTSMERQWIGMVNQERTERGLQPLQTDITLVRIAKDKSHLMASTGNVEHGSRSQFHAILDDAGVSYRQAGENIARAASLIRIHNGLMASSGHRANILTTGYTHIGVGIVQYGTSYYATQVFIRR